MAGGGGVGAGVGVGFRIATWLVGFRVLPRGLWAGWWTSPETGVLRQVLSGDGGVGKTQIAAKVFASSDAGWPGVGVGGVPIGGPERVRPAAALRLDLADADGGVEGLAGCFLGFLAATDRSWLVVLDDLQEPADLRIVAGQTERARCW